MLSMGGQRIDTGAPTGKLMITMLGAIAEFERGLLLERQREGVAKARLEGYKGRNSTARAKAAEVARLDAEGLQRTEIAERLGIGVASVYRVLAGAKTKDGDLIYGHIGPCRRGHRGIAQRRYGVTPASQLCEPLRVNGRNRQVDNRADDLALDAGRNPARQTCFPATPCPPPWLTKLA